MEKEGLSLAGRYKPDVVVLDLTLPTTSGLDVLRKLRKDDPELPILIISAYASLMSPEDGSLAQAVLRKPFDLDGYLRSFRTSWRMRVTKSTRGVKDLELGSNLAGAEGAR
jgi:DNA-binding response OmpR family regulator